LLTTNTFTTSAVDACRLDHAQRQLADYMSDLSEEAYSAGWMNGLEYALWDALTGRLEE
jgi:hypothetical protein